ncbi:MAG TPA: tetratricopeptide repeat protein [Thermoanaerobaculia bacterium]|nr:tetratricopeptide repeat protein [Thermoanaerobaculia bacterium]
MNKDNLHFAAYGLMLGFIAGYLLHDVMAARQPLRRPPGEGAVVAAAAAPDGGGAPDDSSPAASAPNGPDSGAGGAGAPGAPSGGAAPPPAMAEVQQLRDYVATHPKDADAVLKLANLNFDISNWGRARDLYTQYIGLRQANPDVLTDLGTCYRNMRQFDSALEQFRHAEKLAPEHWKSRFAEVVVLGFDLNQQAAADQAFARLQAIAPSQPEVAQLGAALQRHRASGTASGTGGSGAGGSQ